MSSLMSMKVSNEARVTEEKRQIDRKRNLLVLILRHLVNEGYVDASERLQTEAGISLAKFDAADNIDMTLIIQEFEDYYSMRFGKKPKLVRRTGKDEVQPRRVGGRAETGRGGGKKPPRKPRSADGSTPRGSPSAAGGGSASDKEDTGDLSAGLVGSAAPMSSASAPPKNGNAAGQHLEARVLKPLPDFTGNPELRELAASIQRDIIQANPNIRWTDVIDLNDAKRLLKEAVVMPVKYPQIFTGTLSPWKGVLLYGPPGTGKTMLARAVATECETTFFNISASSIVSKWRGDSEKLIRVLFDLARYHAPSTIFLDEIDSIMGQRGGPGSGEHEASRRMKTELLIQMDGLAKTDDLVFVLAASNLPWELDMAMLRRLEKRVHVPLPEVAARTSMLQKYLPPTKCVGIDHASVAERLAGYSGSDIALVCKEAQMRPVRRLMDKLEALEALDPRSQAAAQLGQEKVQIDPVNTEDVEEAIAVSNPSARRFAGQYEKWGKEFGST